MEKTKHMQAECEQTVLGNVDPEDLKGVLQFTVSKIALMKEGPREDRN